MQTVTWFVDETMINLRCQTPQIRGITYILPGNSKYNIQAFLLVIPYYTLKDINDYKELPKHLTFNKHKKRMSKHKHTAPKVI